MPAHSPVPGAILQVASAWRGSLQVLRAEPAHGRSRRQADAAGRRGLSMARRTDMLSTLGAPLGALLLLAPVAGADTGRTAYASPHSGGAAYVAAAAAPRRADVQRQSKDGHRSGAAHRPLQARAGGCAARLRHACLLGGRGPRARPARPRARAHAPGGDRPLAAPA